MPREAREMVFVGIKNAVLAVDRRDGSEQWRAELPNGGFVTVLWDGEALLAACRGELFRLHPETGERLWHNPMKGLGMGVVCLASTARAEPATTAYETIAEQKRREAAAAAAV
jgi:outer membrane protein assembly factor BamB